MNYANNSYWDERYRSRLVPCEWYQPAEIVAPIILPFCYSAAKDKDDVEILIAGCGNSVLGAHLYEKYGFENVTNIDTSSVAIGQQKKKHDTLKNMDYLVMDSTDMSACPDESFHVIIDKAMTDAMLCDGIDGGDKIARLLREMHRVLKPNGVYICISHGIPESRLCFVDKNRWSSTFLKIRK